MTSQYPQRSTLYYPITNERDFCTRRTQLLQMMPQPAADMRLINL